MTSNQVLKPETMTKEGVKGENKGREQALTSYGKSKDGHIYIFFLPCGD